MVATGDYEVVHSCESSEVMHLGCVRFISFRYVLYLQMHSTLQVIVLSTLVQIRGNSEVTHSSCVHIIVRYTSDTVYFLRL